MDINIVQPWYLDYWPIISDVGKVIGVLFAAWWTVSRYVKDKNKDRKQQQDSLTQKREETRRDQCSRGLRMIDELLESKDDDKEYYSWDAMKMLDYKSEKHIPLSIEFGKTERKVVSGIRTKFSQTILVDNTIIREALKAKDNSTYGEDKDDLLLSVRECFDEFYFRMGQLEDAIQAGLVMFADVQTPVDYYVELMAAGEEGKEFYYHYDYLKKYGYNKTLQYLNRFDSWKEAVAKISPKVLAPAS